MKRVVVGLIVWALGFLVFGWAWYSLTLVPKGYSSELTSLEQVSRELVAERDAIRAKLPQLMVLLEEKRRLVQESARIEASIAYGESAPVALAEQEKKIQANLDAYSPIGSELNQRIENFDARLSEYRGRVARFSERERNLLPYLEPFGSLGEQIRKGRGQAGPTSR